MAAEEIQPCPVARPADQLAIPDVTTVHYHRQGTDDITMQPSTLVSIGAQVQHVVAHGHRRHMPVQLAATADQDRSSDAAECAQALLHFRPEGGTGVANHERMPLRWRQGGTPRTNGTRAIPFPESITPGARTCEETSARFRLQFVADGNAPHSPVAARAATLPIGPADRSIGALVVAAVARAQAVADLENRRGVLLRDRAGLEDGPLVEGDRHAHGIVRQ
jgi:hypothetical protein